MIKSNRGGSKVLHFEFKQKQQRTSNSEFSSLNNEFETLEKGLHNDKPEKFEKIDRVESEPLVGFVPKA